MATTKKKMTAIRRAQLQAKKRKNELLEEIDAALGEIEDAMQPFKELEQQQQELLAARRALLGGTRLTGSGGNRLRQEDVIGYLRENPGADAHAIAEKYGSTYSAAYAHLQRGRGETFLGKNGSWWVRNPKEGLNTEDDLDDED